MNTTTTKDILRTSATLTDNESKLVSELSQVTAQRDELLAAAKRVEAGWNITNRKNLASAMAHLRAAISKAEQH